MEKYLKPTYYIDSDHPEIAAYAEKHCPKDADPVKKAVSLYYAVRDGIRYNPYSLTPDRESMKASAVLKRGDGYCVAKAVLLAACARSQNIPARLGFADVKNHLNTRRLKELMQTDVFVFHGYTDLYLNDKWVKATPAFNLELCNNFNAYPLEFDGTCDSIFHPLDKLGNRHMEYVKDRGVFDDVPWDAIMTASRKHYPNYFKAMGLEDRNFAQEALSDPI